jgi:hypothetical protein
MDNEENAVIQRNRRYVDFEALTERLGKNKKGESSCVEIRVAIVSFCMPASIGANPSSPTTLWVWN